MTWESGSSPAYFGGEILDRRNRPVFRACEAFFNAEPELGSRWRAENSLSASPPKQPNCQPQGSGSRRGRRPSIKSVGVHRAKFLPAARLRLGHPEIVKFGHSRRARLWIAALNAVSAFSHFRERLAAPSLRLGSRGGDFARVNHAAIPSLWTTLASAQAKRGRLAFQRFHSGIFTSRTEPSRDISNIALP